MLSGAEKPLCPPCAFSKYRIPLFLSSSSLKFCCSVTVTVKWRLLCAFLLLGGGVFTGVFVKTTVCWHTRSSTWNTTHSSHPRTRPTRGSQMTPRSGSWKWGVWWTQRWPSHYSGCPSMLCSCVLSSKEPNQQRVKRWAFGINEVLKDPVGREQFLKFLESEFSSENLRYDQHSPTFPQY